MKKKSSPDEEPQIQIYQNEVYISNTETDSERWKAINDNDFKIVMNDIMKKAMLKKAKSFGKLLLSFTECEKITNESAKILRKTIMKNFNGLKSLSLNFYGATRISDSGIEQIVRLVSSYKDLKSLQIKFVAFPQLSDKSLNDLIKRVSKSVQSLKNLHIDVSVRYERSDGNFMPTEPDLFQRLTHSGHSSSHGVCSSELNSLNSLSTEGVLQANLAITSYFGSSLQELNLNLAFIPSITDRICQELGQRILAKMNHLKRLYLNFNGCNGLTDKATSLFSYKTSQKRLIDLESLTLELPKSCNITNNGLKEFNKKIIQNLKSLQSFTLASYGAPHISSESVKSISKDLFQNENSLKELGLIFSNVGDDVLPAISSSLMQNSRKLKRLTLALQGSASSKFLDMKEFQNTLNTSLKNLQEFNLDFSCHFIDDVCLTQLGNSLQGLLKLKKLALNFSGCMMIGGDKGGNDCYLGTLVPKCVVLERFEVFFSRCENIGDELLEEFGKSLCKYQSGLDVLYVDFSWCEKITERIYERFCGKIQKKMKKLSHLILKFMHCWSVSQESMTNMKILLKEIPIVNLY